MKKLMTLMIVFLFIINPIKVYADSVSVEVKVNGKIEKDADIEILVNVKDVEKFYAASVDFTYDTEQLKIESIDTTDFIKKYSDEIMELGGETDKNGNTASYSFTFLGDKEGIKGAGTLATIKAKVLKEGKLSIGEDSMKVKLVQRVGDTVENYSYKFIGFNVQPSSTNKPESNNSSTGNINGTVANNTNESSNTDKNDSNTNKIDNNTTTDGNKTSTDKNSTVNNENNDESSVEESVVDETIDESTSENGEYSKSVEENKVLLTDKKNTNNWYVIIISIVVIAVIGGTGYYFYKRKNNN